MAKIESETRKMVNKASSRQSETEIGTVIETARVSWDNSKIPEYTPGAYDKTIQATHLKEQGYVVLPLLGNDYKTSKYNEMVPCIETMLHSFPEYNQTPNTKYIVGGFAAFGNPSSFHHPLIRILRQWALSYCYPLFKEYDSQRGYCLRIEELPDRFMVRQVGDTPSAETWHRDTSPHADNEDDIFGGWINLDNENQTYSAVTESIPDDPSSSGSEGFNRVTDEMKAYCNSHKRCVIIPPGHIIIFFQNALHEIAAYKAKHRMYRLFTGFRLTNSENPLTPNLESLIEDQGIFNLKSNQVPPMYSKHHETAWLTQILVPWTRHFKPQCTQVITRKSGNLKGKSYRIVERYMKSLKDYDLPLYPPYTESDCNLLKPKRTHTLLYPGSLTRVEEYSMD